MGPQERGITKRRGVVLTALACAILCLASRAQQPSAPPPPPSDSAAEVTTRDTPSSLKVHVNVVLVRVVVRDLKGQAIDTLHKEDFRLLDRGKPQLISSFAVERPGSHIEASRATETAPVMVEPGVKGAGALPERFAALLFDDLNLAMEDALQSRIAATKFLDALQPTDRVGIFTTSGQRQLEFTADRAQLSEALLGIIPRPLLGTALHSCPDISGYEADLIVNKSDQTALEAATMDTLMCMFGNDPNMIQPARAMAMSAAQTELRQAEASAEMAYRRMEDLIRRMTVLPGQRTVVLVSPGFITTFSTHESSDVIDRATRANIVVNAIDARGLYAFPPGGDISNPRAGSPMTAGMRDIQRIAEQSVQSEVLAEIADGTGGLFFHNRNDLGEGMRQFAAAPEFSYLLGFSPQNLKLDGSYHMLKVTLAPKEKLSLQARRGYFAPKGESNPAETAKKEIEEAIFSQEEMRDLPVEVQTQFFKKGQEDASLAVLARVDLKGLKYRKADGRNQNNLTIAAAIFDQNGNFVTGGEKVVEMKLRDTTLERSGHNGITVKSNFDVKPGNYMVRLVVRDSEAEQMAAHSSAVRIPY